MTRIAFWTVVLSSVAKFRPLPATLRTLSVSPSRAAIPGAADELELAEAVDAVLGMDWLVFRPVCWKRAILLHRLLGQRGHELTVVFGVRPNGNGTLAGHAWLERNGSPIFESQTIDYTPAYRYPSTEACTVNLSQID